MNGPLLSPRRVVNEARDDFLAGARFAGEQHGRFGLRDARRVRQHVLPLPRVADDAALAGARFELACQRGHLRFESRCRLARGGIAPRRFGEVLVRQRQREVIRDPAREVDVLVGESSRLACQEEERSEHGAAKRDRDAQRGARANRRAAAGRERFPPQSRC